MNLQSLRPAKEFAQMYGCKMLVYGGAGSSKTPLINTCPNPLLLACEPGLLSMRNSEVPTLYAPDVKTIDDFFEWFFNSNETKKFDTLALDSASFMADIYLQAALKNNKHGKAAYGEMASNVMKHLRRLYFVQYKHVYLIAKEDNSDSIKRPYFPGKQLNSEAPGWFDFILHLGIKNIPSMGQVKAFQCIETFDIMARARTGNLNEYEEPNVGKLVAKAMG